MSEIVIYLIDDDHEVCLALKWLFESLPVKVEIFECPLKFLAIYKPYMLGCIVVDVRMPNMNGLEFLQKLQLLNNRLPVIMITAHVDISLAVRAIKKGAMDFITKPFNHKYLLKQVEEAININSADIIAKGFAILTAREREIMDMVMTGRLNKEIAHNLKISVSTVELHRARLKKKFKVKNIAELVKVMAKLQSY
jgi:two-component system response regulator FixJ